ncbi:hypothetical protein GOBAR_DD01603 [Gossypium barbadense]|nr:hypothetical protein GOBAR_DD01603 [Gossypium barbadense]
MVMKATFYRLATLMPRMGLRQAKQIEAGHVYVEAVRKAMVVNSQRAQIMNVELYSCDLETFRVQEYIGHRSGLPPKSYAVDLRNRRCECRIFQTLQYPYAHVHAACARSNLNVEQFIDEIYTLQRTLCIWGNEIPVIPDVSN